MADLPPYPDSGDDTSVGRNRESPPGMPRWVKVFGIIVLVLALLIGVVLVTGIGGSHGPFRHVFGGDMPAASITADFMLYGGGFGGHLQGGGF